MAKVRTRRPLPLVIGGKPTVPDRVEGLRSELLKTRVAHGYCSRHLAAEACPYANVCEQCDNFVTTAEFLPQLHGQLDDVRALRDDAEARGWDSEVARHAASSPASNATFAASPTRTDPNPLLDITPRAG